MLSYIAENIRIIENRIKEAAKRAGRDASKIKLVAVSKTVEVDRIKQAVLAGITVLGENKVQEAEGKIEEVNRLKTQDPRFNAVSWHMVGHLQTNKVKTAIQLFDLIHSVDSLHLAEEIDRQAQKIGKTQRVLIEVNLAGEKTKYGMSQEKAIGLLNEMSKLKNITIEGLMTMPPFSEAPENIRPYFKELKELRNEAISTGLDLPELSMGMSNDFEVAIEEGATMVRIGTAIFGRR